MPEELQKHLMLNSNRLRTFEDARQVIVTYVGAKYGLRIRDSKPSASEAREHSDPMDVNAMKSLASCTGKGRGPGSPRDNWFKCGGNSFQRDCPNHVTQRKGSGKKGK